MARNICLLIVFFMALACSAFAQTEIEDPRRLHAVILDGDTLPMVYLNEVIVYQELSPAQRRKLARQARRAEKRQQRDEAAYAKLRYNVYKVYPYANTAAFLLKDVHEKLDAMSNKEARKKYLKNLEKELNKRFKGELEQFTISQGVVLVKLINRQTGRSCFDIIQEVKGGFNATVWQGVALVFGNNLRREYEPNDRDQDVEEIVLEIEAALKAKAAKK